MSPREIDAQIAEHIFSWTHEGDLLVPPANDERRVWATEWDEHGLPDYLPHYSTDIAAAWLVLDRLGETSSSWGDVLMERDQTATAIRWRVVIVGDESFADTAPMAICLAALKAVGVEAE